MQCIRLPQLIDNAEWVLQALVADWMYTNSVQNVNSSFVHEVGTYR